MKEHKQITKVNRQIKISKQFKSFAAKPLTHLTLYKLILKIIKKQQQVDSVM